MQYLGRCFFMSVVVALSLSHGIVQAQDAESPPSLDDLIKRLNYTEEDKKALLAGKVIATDLERTRDDQIVAAVAALVKVPLATLNESVRSGANIGRDPDVLAYGVLTTEGDIEKLKDVAYSEEEKDEALKLLSVSPSDEFNLSTTEIDGLGQSLNALEASESGVVAEISKAYRALLLDRYHAYLEKGLSGIAPYDFGETKGNPAQELSDVFQRVQPFLAQYFPAYEKALGEFPGAQAEEVSSTVHWIKRDVEGRPAFILQHQMVQGGEDYLLVSQRQFFVGHTYNSSQAIAIALPVEDATAVFYVNSAFTDKITGFFSGIAESVGQDRMREDLTALFEKARKELETQ